MINKIFILLLSIFTTTYSFSKPSNIEGVYALPSGGALLVLPNQDFAIVSYANVLTGKYKILGQQAQFKFNTLNLQQYDVTEFSHPILLDDADFTQPQADQLFVQFDFDLPSDVYFGLNQPQNYPILQQVYEENSNCLDYSKTSMIFPRESKNTLILYRQDADETVKLSTQYQIPNHVNRIKISKRDMRFAGKGFQAKIINDGLLFSKDDSGFATQGEFSKRSDLSHINDEDFGFIQSALKKQKHLEKNAKKIFFTSKNVQLKNVQLDKAPLLKMKCNTDE